jgi:hypothetical protein
VVGAHAFARGAPLGFGGHDPDGTVFQPGRPSPGLSSGYRARAVISSRHAGRLLFQRLSKPSADSARLRVSTPRIAGRMQIRQFCACEAMADVPHRSSHLRTQHYSGGGAIPMMGA